MKLSVPKCKEIKELKIKGKRWKGKYVEIIWEVKKESFSPKVIITAFKTCGKAVRRNLIKRIVRNWIRENYRDLPPGILVFFRGYKKLSERKWGEAKLIIEKDLREWYEESLK